MMSPPDATGGDGMVLPGRHCGLCGDAGVGWMHRLDASRSRFRVYGKEHIWADEVATCLRCERLYRAGDDAGLAAVYHRGRQEPDVPDRIDEGVRNPLRAFRDADLGATAVADWLPPGAAELIAEGFVPIEDLTGAVHVAALWPETHRRAVSETRPGRDEEDDRYRLVRSPWPGIPVHEVVTLLWQWVDSRQAPRRGDRGPAYEDALVREFLHRDDEWVRRFRRGRH